MIQLALPYPPSANQYWRSLRKGKLAGVVLLSREAREYRKRVQMIALEGGLHQLELAGSLDVAIVAHPPDRARRDIDNLLKPLLDSLVHAGVLEDDRFVDRLTISRAAVVRGGAVEIAISKLGAEQISLGGA